MAVLASLFAAAILTCLGMSLVLLGSTAATMAGHDEQGAAAAYAAQAALNLAVSEVRARSDWSGVALPGAVDVCAAPGAFADASLFPPSPWDGAPLDLHQLTAQRQADSDAVSAGLAPPVWRLFEYGPISRLVPSDARRHPFYVAVWAADGRDGLVLLHAVALGRGGARAAVEASMRPPTGPSAALRLAIRAAR